MAVRNEQAYADDGEGRGAGSIRTAGAGSLSADPLPAALGSGSSIVLPVARAVSSCLSL